MATRKAKGYRLEVTFVNGTRGYRNYEGFSQDQLRRKLKALGGKWTEGIKEVHSITAHEWDQEYSGVSV
jgi:hypothetical protein